MAHVTPISSLNLTRSQIFPFSVVEIADLSPGSGLLDFPLHGLLPVESDREEVHLEGITYRPKHEWFEPGTEGLTVM